MQDTSPEAAKRYHQLLGQMTTEQKARAVSDMFESGKALALLGLRQQFPNADEAELRKRLCVRFYGREFAARVMGPLPPDAQ